MKLGHEVNVFSSGHEAEFSHTACTELPSFDSLAESFFKLAEARMSDTMKLLLRMSEQLLRFHTLTVTALADMLSRRSNVPYSTVKWNLRLLMELGLLIGGDTEHRGRPASLTPTACMLVHYLNENDE
jgi:hypothetical protein